MADARASAIVLAGGEGRRFRERTGRFKLIEPLADGEPVVRAACRRALAAVDDVAVVTRCEADAVQAALAGLPLRLLRCEAAADGPGASIKCGVAATPPEHTLLVFLADMPFVATDTVRAVLGALADGADIARPFHEGVPGHPVGFSPAMRARLLALDNARGAAAILRAAPQLVRRLDLADAGCVADIDVPEQVRGV